MTQFYDSSDPRQTAVNHINQQAIQPPIQASLSVYNYGPSRILPSSGPPTELHANTGLYAPHDPRGGWDALDGRMMQVSQSDMLDSSPNVLSGINRSGVWDTPGAAQGQQFLRLQMTTSARDVPSIPQQIWPTIYFQPPPSFGDQTIPIFGVGV